MAFKVCNAAYRPAVHFRWISSSRAHARMRPKSWPSGHSTSFHISCATNYITYKLDTSRAEERASELQFQDVRSTVSHCDSIQTILGAAFGEEVEDEGQPALLIGEAHSEGARRD